MRSAVLTLPFLALAVSAAGCDVEPYPFDDSYEEGTARLEIEITPRGNGRWAVIDGQQVYRCDFDATATVTGDDPTSWINPVFQSGYGSVYYIGNVGSSGYYAFGDLTPSSFWADLFNEPAQPPYGPGGTYPFLAVGETKTITDYYVYSTEGPFSYRVEIYVIQQNGQRYNGSGQDRAQAEITCR